MSIKESTRLARLDIVLGKALDVSGGSLGDQDLSECFGSIKTQFGPAMSRLFQNMLVKLRSHMEASYKDICIRCDLEERLIALENVKNNDSQNISISATGAIHESMEKLKRTEIDNMLIAIKQIEIDTAKLQDRASRLKVSVANELNELSSKKL